MRVLGQAGGAGREPRGLREGRLAVTCLLAWAYTEEAAEDFFDITAVTLSIMWAYRKREVVMSDPPSWRHSVCVSMTHEQGDAAAES